MLLKEADHLGEMRAAGLLGGLDVNELSEDLVVVPGA